MIVAAKLAGSLLYPLSTTLLVLLAAGLLWRRRIALARVLLLLALAWLWLWSTPWVAERAAASLEREWPALPASALTEADAIVLLGGLLEPADPPRTVHADLNGAADRAVFALRLWRAGKAPVVICTGGRAPLSRARGPECPALADLLVEWGLDRAAVRVEADSRTTRENARQTARMLPPGSRILLVTSARHMGRAHAAFAAEGFQVTAAATDHASRPGQAFAASVLLPSAGALALSTSVWHEWLGSAWYRLDDG